MVVLFRLLSISLEKQNKQKTRFLASLIILIKSMIQFLKNIFKPILAEDHAYGSN